MTQQNKEQRSTFVGTMVAFGTGGTEGADFEGMEELFYNPDSYDCLSFDNVWDAGGAGTKCGYFIPIEENLEGFIDDDGNSDREKARDFEEINRNKKNKSPPLWVSCFLFLFIFSLYFMISG